MSRLYLESLVYAAGDDGCDGWSDVEENAFTFEAGENAAACISLVLRRPIPAQSRKDKRRDHSGQPYGQPAVQATWGGANTAGIR